MSDAPLSLNRGLLVERSTFSPVYSVAGTVIIFAFFTAAPWILAASWVSVLSNFFILLIMATMWNLLAGYAGMVSIGQQGFVGLGAYATLYFAIKGMNPFVAIPFAIIACAILAYPITYLLFRLRGGYFAVATWVIADSAMLIILSIALLGGGTGKYLPGLSGLSPSELDHDTYLATWFVAFAVLVATYFILRSRLGLVLSSMRDNETASRSAGAKVTSTRRLIYVIAAAGCGAAMT
jgi:branched-chain amino acid transport system permease protein